MIAVKLVFRTIVSVMKRNYSSSKVSTDFNQRNKRLVYSTDSLVFSTSQENRSSLILLFGWLFSKEKHLEKYRKIYFDKGFDVLTVKVNVKNILIPPLGSHVVAQRVLDFLKAHQNYDNIIVNTFSVGCYQFGEVLVMMNKVENQELFDYFNSKFKGIILDSPAYADDAPTGLAAVTTNYSIIRSIIANTIRLYMTLFAHIITNNHKNSENMVTTHSKGCPVHFFISRNDPIVSVDKTFKFIEDLKAKDVDVTFKCWQNSVHVSHLFKYPEEYKECLDTFIDKCIK